VKKKTKTILLVEDEALIALAEKMTLEQYGFSVTTADSGEKAAQIAVSEPSIDLVLME
jgi:response regulator RpfG family c-di-GMP phosphodiesterase